MAPESKGLVILKEKGAECFISSHHHVDTFALLPSQKRTRLGLMLDLPCPPVEVTRLILGALLRTDTTHFGIKIWLVNQRNRFCLCFKHLKNCSVSLLKILN